MTAKRPNRSQPDDGTQRPTETTRRRRVAEQFEGRAIAAETSGKHRQAASLYRRAIEALLGAVSRPTLDAGSDPESAPPSSPKRSRIR